eukprot:5717210-Karenia_brevis.AAC.1
MAGQESKAPDQRRGDINTGQASGLRGSDFGGSQAKAGHPASPELQVDDQVSFEKGEQVAIELEDRRSALVEET